MKKIIGLACGTKNGNCETYLRAAAAGAAELGVETEIIRAAALKIQPCRGCHACAPTNQCTIKDDVDWILEKTCVEDGGLIVSVPCYHLRNQSYLSMIAERMNPVFLRHPDILTKTRVGAIIGVGGSGYDAWASLNLVMANLFVQHTRVLADQIQINMSSLQEWNLWMQQGAPLTSHTYQTRIQDEEYERIWEMWPQENDPVAFARKSLERARELGRNVARAMDVPVEQVEYKGEAAAVACPLCHCNVLVVPEDLPYVYCPVCAVRGVIATDNGKMKITWNEEDVRHPRFTPESVEHHFMWLGKHNKRRLDAQDSINELKRGLDSYGKLIKPEKS